MGSDPVDAGTSRESSFRGSRLLDVVEDVVDRVDDFALLVAGEALQTHADGLTEERMPARRRLPTDAPRHP